ncbi:MAG: 50S ribosomal protein L29 [Clostridia bacterium]|jgi:large subunit ribosomal protein L29|nr:50S ribosomal protein L29 [Clostridia bacterium]MBT7121768.1 50S ribosomal protein L29 [Clostridia bacterium]
MKASKLQEMTNDELMGKLTDLKQELFNLRFQNATGQLGNVMVVDSTKKDIARVKTVLRERELKAAVQS